MRKLQILFSIGLAVLSAGIITIGVNFTDVQAAAASSEERTDYEAIVIDDAELFSEQDEKRLLDIIESFTEYGNALVATAEKNDCATVQQLAVKYYDQAFKTEEGAVFLIDMDDREIYWYTEGDLYDSVSVKTAMAITDNVYTYAADGDYVNCAGNAFDMAVTVIRGGRIRQSMKYYGNALLAVILAIFINYVLARKTSFIRVNFGQEENVQSKMDIKKFSESELSVTTKEVEKKKLYGSAAGSYSGSSSSSGRSYSSGHSYSSGSSYSSSGSSSRSSGSSGSSSSHRGGGAGHRF